MRHLTARDSRPPPVWTAGRSAIVAVCAIAWTLGAIPAPAIAQVQWRMATECPQSNISGVGLTTFGKLVALHTHGLVTTVNGFNNEMKIGAGEMPQAAQDRRIDGGDAFVGPFEALDPIFGLSLLPFAVQSVDAARAVNAKARPLYERALAARGLKLLYITIWPATGLWSDRPLKGVDDLRALSVRTYDRVSTEVMRSVGADAQNLPFNEAVARIKEHQLHAVLTSGDGGAGRNLWDDLRHFTPINYAIPISIAFIRQDAFEALPKDTQDQVAAAAAETGQSQLDLLANRTAENYARMRANGVTIDEPASPALIAALKKAGSGPIADWQAKVSAEAVAILEWADRQ
jgi:TRAP-type transport system periplasmic protein